MTIFIMRKCGSERCKEKAPEDGYALITLYLTAEFPVGLSPVIAVNGHSPTLWPSM